MGPHRFEMKLVNPANKRKYTIIVVGIRPGRRVRGGHAGRAGLQRPVLLLPGHAPPGPQHRRAGWHQRRQELPERRRQRLAAVLRHHQGRRLPGPRGQRLPAGPGQRQHHRSVRGAGRAVRAGVRRAAGQPLVRRRPGVAHLLCPGPDRPAAPAGRLPGAGAPGRGRDGHACIPAPRCWTWSWSTARARGIVVRDLVTGQGRVLALADAVVLATGGYGNVFYLSTNAKGCNVTATWRAYKRGAAFANPCFTQIHPTCIPVSGEYQSKLTLMSESLRNDGRVWVPKQKGDHAPAGGQSRRRSATTISSGSTPASATWRRATSPRASAKEVCDEGRGVGETGLGVYLDFADAIRRLGEPTIRERYGNLFEMYQRITDENPYQVPMRIYPAVHYTMGGLWVDYNLMSTIPGLHVIGEANFSDHGANRLGASALMQGLADGYFILPTTIGDYLATARLEPLEADHPEFRAVEAEVADRAANAARRSGGSGRWIRSTASWASSCGTTAAWRGAPPGSSKRSAQDPDAARRVLAQRERAGQRRGAEPGAGEGRARGGLPRVRRADVPGRAAPRGVVRRALPRRVPDRGGRGAARRRTLRLRGGVGVRGPRQPRCCTRSRWSSRTCSWLSGATSEASGIWHQASAVQASA